MVSHLSSVIIFQATSSVISIQKDSCQESCYSINGLVIVTHLKVLHQSITALSIRSLQYAWATRAYEEGQSRVNRGSINPPGDRSTSFGTNSTESADEAVKPASSDNVLSVFAPDNLVSTSVWLREIGKRPLEDNILQPLYLNKEEAEFIKSSTTSLYQTLKPWQRRLLILLPGEPGSRLKCSLIEVDVIDGHGLGIVETSEVANFEALSYAWGNSEPVCSMTCNEIPIGIAKELATALRYLRSSTINRHLWVDAICINQENLVEKAHQVRNLLRIFEKANAVIAWIGQLEPSSGRLYDALQPMKDQLYQIEYRELDSTCRLVADEVIDALNARLSSAWFVRTWVRQEVFASKRWNLQFGQYQLDFGTFLDGIARLLGIFGGQNIAVPSALDVYQREYQHWGTDRPNFRFQGELQGYLTHCVNVLSLGALFQVSDERDIIYGTLGLLTSPSVKFFAQLPTSLETLAVGFPVNYNKTLSEVYEDVTKFFINMSGSLEVLDVFRDRKYLESGDIPFWGTEWGVERDEFYALPSAEYESHDSVLPPQQLYTEAGRLEMKGVRRAGHLASLNRRKEISHPRDRFKPKYRKSITIQDIMRGPTRRVSGGLTKEIQNPTYSVVFTHVQEAEDSFTLKNIPIKSHELAPDFASLLAGESYVFAYIEDHPGDASFDLADLHLLVPRTESLDDIIVSLYGSRCLHLLRPVFGTSAEYKYLGPVAGIACGQELTLKYGSRPKNSTKRLSKRGVQGQETFFLI
ncbi:hypothetical protein HYALB_00000028 [Hymenoscyphus albidus]|uniref:Heterokaryon incompatibility domain-containing protein n=1 Tax=Hymenoscyphus albidus TaxID=595503 RepID=A0A9N9LIQ7_9HELO|nr:hypothetical protein HYALB_00000028 [Hymenoscyphus albidus]